MNTTRRGRVGTLGEEYAVRYLTSKKYRVIERNYRKPWGEVDVITEKQGIVVFVEVKTNSQEIVGFEPERRVSAPKRFRMARIAQTFLADYHFSPDQEWQMDVLSVTFQRHKGTVSIRHYKNIAL